MKQKTLRRITLPDINHLACNIAHRTEHRDNWGDENGSPSSTAKPDGGGSAHSM